MIETLYSNLLTADSVEKKGGSHVHIIFRIVIILLRDSRNTKIPRL
jgi:hypothetical protein